MQQKKGFLLVFFFYVRGQIPKPRGEKGPRGIKTPLKSHLRISWSSGEISKSSKKASTEKRLFFIMQFVEWFTFQIECNMLNFLLKKSMLQKPIIWLEAFSTSNMIFSLRFNKYCGFCAHVHYIHSVGRKKKKKKEQKWWANTK